MLVLMYTFLRLVPYDRDISGPLVRNKRPLIQSTFCAKFYKAFPFRIFPSIIKVLQEIQTRQCTVLNTG